VENFFTPATGDPDAYQEKVTELAAVITTAAPDLVALQEVGDPEAFETLRSTVGAGWTGVLSTHFDPSHAIRVGWLSSGALTEVEEVVDLPTALSPVKVADDGTTITQLGRGALVVTYTTTSWTKVRVLTCHLKSKLLSFPGAGSTPPTRPSGPATPSTHWTVWPRRPPLFGTGPPPPSPAPGPTARCWSVVTSTTPPRPPPPSCCSGHQARRSAPAATAGPNCGVVMPDMAR